MTITRKGARVVLWIPVFAGIAASALFFGQGGFGAGHGKWDAGIMFLGLPGIYVAMVLPFPVGKSDWLMVIWWPTVINEIFAYTIYRVLKMRTT